MSLCRFTQNLNAVRRENAEKLAEKALAEAKKKQEDAAKAAVEAAAKEAKENGMTSAATPAATTTGIREGSVLFKNNIIPHCNLTQLRR